MASDIKLKVSNKEIAINEEIKKMMSKLGAPKTAGFDRISAVAPKPDTDEIYRIMSEGNTKPYDMVKIIECIKLYNI